MHPRRILQLIFAAIVLVGMPAWAAVPAATGQVTVSYDHPDQFTEAKKLRTFAPSRLDDGYLKTLKAYLEDRAGKRLAPGEHLQIVVTDIDRAGNFEPWHGVRLRDVRIIKDIYPPRIDLNFKLTGADGKVLREGARKLRDPAFLTDSGYANNTDNLRYEKALLDRWLRKGPDQL